MMLDIGTLRDMGCFSDLDFQLARTLAELVGETDPLVLLGVAAVSHFADMGHVCLPLDDIGNKPIVTAEGRLLGDPVWPEAEKWRRSLMESALVSQNDSSRPLVLNERGELYLARYWQYRQELADRLRRRAALLFQVPDEPGLARRLDKLFGPVGRKWQPDGQRLAVETALKSGLTVVTGGPGTGKTTVAIFIMSLLLEQALSLGIEPPQILCLAPTGKAATRLEQSMIEQRVRTREVVRPEVIERLPGRAMTVHRALVQNRRRGNRPSDLKLQEEVVIVDEASMIDLPLAVRLVKALRKDARLILLGDKDQLAAVEVGSVLADICLEATEEKAGAFSGKVIELFDTHRFGSASGIGLLARAIKEGDAEGTLRLLNERDKPDISLVEIFDSHEAEQKIAQRALEHFLPSYKAGFGRDWQSCLERFRLLSPHRKGRTGVAGLNRLVEDSLAAHRVIEPSGDWYVGRPIMVTQNDVATGLFNGDVGVVASSGPSGAGGRALFLDKEGEERNIHTARLPRVETAFAMSVHKSQGSEFEHVVLVLPEVRSPVMTRELLYTAVTRAKKSVTIFGRKKIVASMIHARLQRSFRFS